MATFISDNGWISFQADNLMIRFPIKNSSKMLKQRLNIREKEAATIKNVFSQCDQH